MSHDLIVVGGGIQGLATAFEAARRGLRTVLVERGRTGAATSANTLRILHGGLRYLQQLDLGRLRTSQAEQAWFRRSFPELTQPLPCLMPFHGRGLRRPVPFRVALGLQARLADEATGDLPPGRVLSADETRRLFPAVAERGLQGAGLWYDALMPRSDRLLAELRRWVEHLGTTVLEGTEATAILLEGDGRVAGVRARTAADRRLLDLRAPQVVNAAGPWVRLLAGRFDRDVASLFHPSLAFNLLMARPAPSAAAVAIGAGGELGGTLFLVPLGDRTLVGTWHLPGSRDPRSAGPSEQAIAAALATVAAQVPGWEPGRDEVEAVLWGHLPARSAGSTRLRRRDLIHDHGAHGGPRGLWSVSGIKLTTARALAARTLEALGADPVSTPTPRPRETSPVADEASLAVVRNVS